MNGLSVLQALGPIDAKNIRRDELLRWVIVAPIALALFIRWLFPPLLARFENIFQLDLMPYYEPFTAFIIILLTPYLIGLVIGFLLLDQRDDGTLTALQVTPLSLNGYLVYRLTMPMLLSIVMTIVAAPLSGVMAMGIGGVVLTAVSAAPLAPIFALLLATVAQNKVQGFALTKVMGILFVPPMVAYFVAMPWQILFGIFPTFWPAMTLWSAQTGDPILWFYWSAGMVYQLFVMALLTRRFNQIMQR